MFLAASPFVFDGIPSEMFGLMIYNIGDHKHKDSPLGGSITLQGDRTARRTAAMNYGTTCEGALEFPLIFGVENDRHRLDRYDEAAVAGWLFGHDDYKWLHICQRDLEPYRYRCKIKELTPVTVGRLTVAFEATVVCDGPYAYHLPTTDTIVSGGTAHYRYFNPSNVNSLYYPTLEITCNRGTESVSIANGADPGRMFQLTRLPAAGCVVHVDGIAQTVFAEGVNLYDNRCNFKFPRMVRGENNLTVSGACTVRIYSEVPMNIGS